MANPFEKPPGRVENPKIQQCPKCGGTGKDKNNNKCGTCNGDGKIRANN